MKTIKYVVVRPDWNNRPQYVWANHKETPWGLPNKGKWYDGFKIVCFVDEEADLEELKKLARKVHGKVERWEYEAGKTTRCCVVYDSSIQIVLEYKRKLNAKRDD